MLCSLFARFRVVTCDSVLRIEGSRCEPWAPRGNVHRGVPGIEDFLFHDLRHTWASWHVMSGTSLQELMELGGWKSYEMVLRYAHLAPENLASVAQRIERGVRIVGSNPTISLR